MKVLNYMIVLLFLSTLFSCVASRKYDEEVTAKNAAVARANDAETARAAAVEDKEAAEKKIVTMEKDLAELREDYDLLQTRYKQQQRLNKDLQESYDKLLALNEKLRGDATDKRKQLTEELSRKESELQRKSTEMDRKERELRELEARMEKEREAINKLQAELEGKNTNINDLQQNKTALEKSLKEREEKVKALEEAVAAREARVKELEAAIAARDAKNQALKNKLNEALLGFNSSDLTVEERNGKIYVSLSQNLLFATGSSRLDSKKGQEAIQKLAEVLNKNNDINVMVEGHTDSDGDAKMNWELSTKRSLSIVQQLIKNDVKPSRITAAGRGEHMPIASNSTEEGKARNRRTDIVLTPKLDAIMDILKKD